MYSIYPGLLSPTEAAIPATFLTVNGLDGQPLFVQQTPMTNAQAALCLERGKDTLFGFAGPSPETGRLVLLGRGNDPESLVGELPRRARSRFDLKGWDFSNPQTIGDHTVFRVNQKPSRPGFDRQNQPRIDVDLYDSLWLANVLYPGGRLLTHEEWDLVSGVTQGILCAISSGTPPNLEEAHLGGSKGNKGATADVGSYPDFRGFFDLIGNVWERVMPESIGESPMRGWSWYNDPVDERVSAYRGVNGPDDRYGDIGLRVAVAPRT